MKSRQTTSRFNPPELERTLDSAAKIEQFFSTLRNQTVIMFVDLVGSTLYKQQRGFFAGLAKTRYHNTTITDVVQSYGGTVVKFIGDGVLCRWDILKSTGNAYRALNAAIRIHETFQDHNVDLRGIEKVETRIGLAIGVVANFYGNDPQGSVVDLAARIQSLAKPNQILAHKSVVDNANMTRINSRYGKGQKYIASDYLGPRTQVKLRGFPEIQDIVELRWGDSLCGINGIEAEPDLWENYHYNAILFPLEFPPDSSAKELPSTHFGISFDLKYEATLRSTRFPFVCVETTEDFDAASRNPSIFVKYRLPRRRLKNMPIQNHFTVNAMHVNDVTLKEHSITYDRDGYYFCREFTAPGLEKLIGERVTLHYQLKTIVSKAAGYFFMTNESPVKGLIMTFDVGRVPIRRVDVIDYFAANKPPRFLYSPDKSNPKKIELHIDESIPARGGAVFIWRLEESNASSSHGSPL
jgi:class 3 adenylate cyclase